LLLTHIHLDHAGATGSLVERWPDLEVYVHEIGAPHMIDPSRLLKSAHRLYGEDMDRLWGEMLPVPESNITTLQGGERLLGGEFEVAYTPGHASHHVSYLRERVAFVGDTGGVRIPPSSFVIPPTPPPDVDVEAWHESISRIRDWRPDLLAITHFGATESVDDQLEQLGRRLDTLAELARDQDQDEFIASIERQEPPDLVDFYSQAAPPDQLYMGLDRYWNKRATPR
jgi:glyoxylase-like metal-dependent hydrolase (beta-lactamase superfamily II)